MSASYTYDKSSPFFSTEEVDDATFLSSGSGGRRGYESSSMEDRQRQLLQERRMIEERTIQSSVRSIGLLKESEEIGTATAEELTRQREQLQNTESKLDEINSTLRVSQRHIQGIKSVFGSIRNYFSGNKNDTASTSSRMKTSASTGSDLGSPVEALPPPRQLAQVLEKSEANVERVYSQQSQNHQVGGSGRMGTRDVDSILDQNLEEMGLSISRLKGLGLELNKEIVDQNDMLDRITNKAEDVDFKVQNQTKDMNRILKK